MNARETITRKFMDLVAQCCDSVPEWMPWDLAEYLAEHPDTLIVDVREPQEYEAMHIPGSINVPRGVLESACEWDYDETEPRLVQAREQEVVLVCRSGYRSLLAGVSLKLLGFQQVHSLKTGLRGWKDYEQPLVDRNGKPVDLDTADDYFTTRLRPDQRRPGS
jgi:rhodanese-related sulfurtransferase